MFRPFLTKAAPILALLPVIASAYLTSSPIIGALTLILFLGALGLAFGTRIAPPAHPLLRLSLGGMVGLSLLSILGSVVYYSATVTTESLLAVVLVTAGLASIAAKPVEAKPSQLQTYTVWDFILIGVGLSGLVAWWLAALNNSITEPVRSLWLVLDPFVIVALGLTLLCSLALLSRGRTYLCGCLLLASAIFSALALAATLYPLGYGFDPFLHRATVLHIAEHGTITPKPLYYIGLYALELISIKLFALPLSVVDAYLAPFLAAVGIVSALCARQTTVKTSGMVMASLVFLPLAAFVQTTPQALAFTFTAWTVFISPKPRVIPALFALAAIITHPLAGIAAAIYVVLLLLSDLRDKYRTLGTAAITIATSGAAVIIPLAFVIQAKLAHLSVTFSFGNLLKFGNLPINGWLGTHFNAWGDLAYVFITNNFLIVLALAGLGLWLTPKTQKGWYVPALVALAMLINFVILSLGLDFTFLIAYERLDFALRLLTLAVLFLLPYIAVALAEIWKRANQKPFGLRLGFMVLLTLIFATNVYAAYPRHDNYARSSGFNLSTSDLETVHLIEKQANDQSYIVLSDQTLAAAAVQEFGFKQYYHGNIFFYPIPTGGPLYQYFLSMVEEQPSRETMIAAMNLTGVDLAYFAVHDYWWQADQIIENTKAISDDWFAVGDGAVTVFVFYR